MYTLTHHRCQSLESRLQTILSSYKSSLTEPTSQNSLEPPPSPIVGGLMGMMGGSTGSTASPFDSVRRGLEGGAQGLLKRISPLFGGRSGGDSAQAQEDASNSPGSNVSTSSTSQQLQQKMFEDTDSSSANDASATTTTTTVATRPPPPRRSDSLLSAWEDRRTHIREFAHRFPTVAAIFEAERLISQQVRRQLEELLQIALDCSEALNYYEALRYRSMLYRLSHTTPLHWIKQLGRWMRSRETLSVAQQETDKAQTLEKLLDEICTRIGELNCEMLNRFDDISTVDEAYDVLVHFALFCHESFLRQDDDVEDEMDVSGIDDAPPNSGGGRTRDSSRHLRRDSTPHIESVRDVLEIIDEYEIYHEEWIAEKKRQLKACQVPSYISRHWIYYTSLSIVTLGTCRYLYKNYDTLRPLVAQGWDIFSQNINQRLLIPMKETYHILRFDNQDTVFDAKKLQVSKETLAHMVENYFTDEHMAKTEKLMDAARNGDISPVMENYTEHIRHPLMGLMTTSLATELLIQLQSMQVDTQQVMNRVGDVMTSNALNVELMALMPVAILVGSIFISVSLYQKNQDNTVQNNIKDHLLAMDKIINSNLHARGGLSAREHGKVFFHSSCALMHSTTIYDQSQQKTLFADFMELNSPDVSMSQKYNIIQRIYKYIQYST